MSQPCNGLLRTAVLIVLASLSGAARARESDSTVVATNPLQSIAKDSLTAFRTRPLFSATRAEAVAPEAAPSIEAAPPPPQPPSPPQLRLVGIIGGTSKVAVVHEPGSAQARLLVTGDRVDNWSVTVLDTGLRLTADGHVIEIALFAPKAPGKTQPPMPPDPSSGATP